jgi:PAS domain S-box-containing protein
MMDETTPSAAEARLHLALEAARIGTWEWVVGSDLVQIDRRLRSMYGLRDGTDITSLAAWRQLVHPDDRARVQATLNNAATQRIAFRQEYRVTWPDGEIHWMEGRGEVVEGGDGILRAHGVTLDVTERKAIEEELAQSRNRLRILADSGELFGASLDLDDVLRALGRLVLPDIADVCEIDLADEERGTFRRFVIGRDADRSLIRELSAVPDIATHPIRRVFASGRGEVIRLAQQPEDFGPADLPSSARALGLVAATLAPIVARGVVIGVLALSWLSEPGDLDRRAEIAGDLATRVGLACDNARLYLRQRAIAIELQRSLLPEDLSAPEGFAIAAGYRPGTSGLDVGGDWYDAIVDASGRLHVNVGDVVGKGVTAASVMIRARLALRSLVVDRSPAEALERMAEHESVLRAGFVTILAATIEPDGQVTVAAAGHVPPVVIRPDGAVQVMRYVNGMPLGWPAERDFAEHVETLLPGSRLLLFTDGLIERRGETIDDGLARLVTLLERTELPVEELVPAVLDEMLREGGDDDAALLIVQLPPSRSTSG